MTDPQPGRPRPAPAALFDVRDVAVVGASPGKHYSTSLLANLRDHGVTEGAIWLVNPGRDEVDGKPCYRALADLPVVPSLVVALVGTERVDGVLDDVIACGSPALMVVADGFAESGADGIRRQRTLAEKASTHGVALLGPNSLGFASPAGGLAAWIGGRLSTDLAPGNLALVFQSSGMLNLVMGEVARRRIGVSGAVSVGNEAVLDLADFIRHYTQDQATDVIGLVLESTTRPKELVSALLAARAAGKRLIVLSIGKSERGMKNVASHAGRMATGAKVWNALFRQVGAVPVLDLADFLDTAALAARLPAGSSSLGVALVTISGGETGMLSDLAEELELSLSEVTPETQKVLENALSRPHILANPLDVRNTRTSQPQVFWSSLEALSADPNVDVVALRMNFAAEPTPALEEMYVAIADVVRAHGARCAFMARAHEVHEPAWYDLFQRLGTPFLVSYSGALRAFANLQRIERAADLVDVGASFAAVPPAVEESPSGEPMRWQQTQDWLREHGIPYVASRLVSDPAEVPAAVDGVGLPVAVKGVLPGVAHKSEHHLVTLGIDDAEAATAAAEDMFRRLEELAPDPAAEPGVEVQAMAAGGTEFFIGAHLDPVLGPVLSFGLGGIYLEIFSDVIYAVPPVSPRQVMTLMESLRAWPVLTGARGRAPGDVRALSELVSAVSAAVVADAGKVTSVDLNPVMVLPAGQGVVAVDAYCERIN